MFVILSKATKYYLTNRRISELVILHIDLIFDFVI